MTSQGPDWRKKTKPCPFYSEGRCLFADSCNFLHSIKPEASAENGSIAVNQDVHPNLYPFKERYASRNSASEDPSHYTSRSNSPALSTSSSRTRRRSPRMSALLSVLTDVIGPDDGSDSEDDDEDFNEQGFNEDHCVVIEGPSSIDVNALELALQDAHDQEVLVYPPMYPQQLTPMSATESSSFLTASADASAISFLSDFPEPPGSLPALGPEGIPDATSTPSRSSSSTTVFAQTDSLSRTVITIPDSQARDMHMNNMSPSSTSAILRGRGKRTSVPPPLVLKPVYDSKPALAYTVSELERAESFDSGFVDGFSTPPRSSSPRESESGSTLQIPLSPHSPFHSNHRLSTLDLLSSPLMSPKVRTISSPQVTATKVPGSPLFLGFQPFLKDDGLGSETPVKQKTRSSSLHPDLDSPSERQEEFPLGLSQHSTSLTISDDKNAEGAPKLERLSTSQGPSFDPDKSCSTNSEADYTLSAETDADITTTFPSNFFQDSDVDFHQTSSEQLHHQDISEVAPTPKSPGYLSLIDPFGADGESFIPTPDMDSDIPLLTDSLPRNTNDHISQLDVPTIGLDDETVKLSPSGICSSATTETLIESRLGTPDVTDTAHSQIEMSKEPPFQQVAENHSPLPADLPSLDQLLAQRAVSDQSTRNPLKDDFSSADVPHSRASILSTPSFSHAPHVKDTTNSKALVQPVSSRLSVSSTASTPITPSFPPELRSSRKVPFGFRQSHHAPSASSSKPNTRSFNRASRKDSLSPLFTSLPPSPYVAAAHERSDSPSWMKPLRLTQYPHSPSQSEPARTPGSTSQHLHQASIASSTQLLPPRSQSALSNRSLSEFKLLSSHRSSALIPDHIRDQLMKEPPSPFPITEAGARRPSVDAYLRSGTPEAPWGPSQRGHSRSETAQLSSISEPLFRLSAYDDTSVNSLTGVEIGADNCDSDEDDTYRFPPGLAHSPPKPSGTIDLTDAERRSSFLALSTPKPVLSFAIASDDVNEVRRVLTSGEAHPNDPVGPHSALQFTLQNKELRNRLDIVKELLAFGADAESIPHNPPTSSPTLNGHDPNIDDATSYYLSRAQSTGVNKTAEMIKKTSFRPLCRIPYGLIGQDCMLEQLYRALRIQGQLMKTKPLVVLCCGPSGHGKSLLCHQFGELLGLPTHTVNMASLHSSIDLWQSLSMSAYETEPSKLTLTDFLIKHEGSPCIVVLDDIDKTDEQHLWSLLAPWELGRCPVESGKRHIDVRKVIWMASSNLGQEIVFEYDDSRDQPGNEMGRDEYLELMAVLRPCVAEKLGAPLLSRVTTVLPFVPFTYTERRAIAAEIIMAQCAEMEASLDAETVRSVVDRVIVDYLPSEGARSIQRAVSTYLLDVL